LRDRRAPGDAGTTMSSLPRCLALLPIALLGSVPVACIGSETAFRDQGLERAAFELDCPKEKIEIEVVDRSMGLGCEGSVVRVTGCDRRSTYTCQSDQEWVSTSGVSDVEPSEDDGKGTTEDSDE
jgi:hypothetical protein